MEKKKALIQSLDRALDILEVIRDSSGSVRSTDIAKRLGLGVATAHNIIRSLYSRGYLAQDENSRYILGTECFKLYREVSDTFEELRQLVKTPVQKLSELTGDTAFFGVEYHAALYCVSLSVGGGQLVVSGHQDWLEKLHCTAAGKIIISEKGIDWLNKLFKKRKFQKFTNNTITMEEKMLEEIKKIKNSSYSISIDECSDGISAIGIPVYKKDGSFVGSLAQPFPTIYLNNGKINLEERVKLLYGFAEKIKNGF